jgi:hypothetical protein
MADYKIGDSIEYKGRKGKVCQVVHTPDKVKYLVQFEDGSEEQIELG